MNEGMTKVDNKMGQAVPIRIVVCYDIGLNKRKQYYDYKTKF